MEISGAIPLLNVKQALLDGWKRKDIEHPRNGVHISDLISCSRKVASSRLDPNPPPPDNSQIRNFMGGEWKHRALQELLGPEFSCEEEIRWNGITAHRDAIWKPGGIPTAIIEFKTTNSAGVSGKPYESHIRQLKAYLAITNLRFDKLFYMYLGTNLDNVFY